jgi:hypothetical protein
MVRCPPLGESPVPTGLLFVLCTLVLKWCLTPGCNGGIEDGFGVMLWEVLFGSLILSFASWLSR